MSAMTFGQKSFTPSAPDKGSFPLDHKGECKKEMFQYLLCLNKTNNSCSECRDLAKNYLECRMNKQLMAKEEWAKLGFSEDISEKEDNESLNKKNSPDMNFAQR